MVKVASIILLAVTMILVACTPASPTATPPSKAVVATPTSTEAPSPTLVPSSPTPTYTPSLSPTPTETPTPAPPAPTPLPKISAFCYPNASAPLEDLVILRGQEHLFDPSCQVSGGVGQITASWDINRDGTPESTQIDPSPMSLQPGEYWPLVTFTDEAGQILQVELPRIVKVGEPNWPSWTFGVMEHLNNTFGLYPNATSIERVVDLMKEGDTPVVRVDFVWGEIEPYKGSYRWGKYDQIVDILTSRGIDVMPIITFSPSWATDSGSMFSPPRNPREFGTFTGKIAERYSDRINVYQIWQEVNISLYFNPPDPVIYSELLNNSYLNIKYFDAGAVVVMAGLANDASANYPGVTFIPPENFLGQLYESKTLFDVVARHPFTHPLETVDTLRQRMYPIHQIMTQYNDSQSQLWVTEYTASTNPDHPGGLSEEQQAAWLLTSFHTLLNEHLATKVFWYNFRDVIVDDDPFFAYVGLVHNDLTPKPAFYTFFNLINEYP